MYSKDYFVVKSEDFGVFEASLESYKNWLYSYIKENQGIEISLYLSENNKVYAPIEALFNKYAYLSSVNNTETVKEIFEKMILKYQEFSNPLSQDIDYYNFTKSLTTKDEIEERLKQRYLKSFEDSGLNLDSENQKKLNDIKSELSKASLAYGNNIINSKKDWIFKISEVEYKSLSEQDKEFFTEVDGDYIITYNQNLLGDILVKSESSDLKKMAYEAFNYPASPKSKYDNTEMTHKVLSLKQQIAKTLGYSYYTDMALKDRMAGNYNNVKSFLDKIKVKMKPLAKKESQELDDFIKKEYGHDSVPKWERSYYANLKKEKELQYVFNMERPYFPQDKVFNGVYSLIEKLFGFTFVKDNSLFELPYEDTDCYKVYEGDTLKAYLLVDMYERPLKRSGAWVSGMSGVTVDNVGLVSLCCNVNKKDVGLDISEINTLLHEFGHAVHHFCSKVKFDDMAGTSGMARDAVEIPSQMLEQYAYNKDYLKSISSHVETKEPISDEMLNSIIKSKNYGIGSFYARQLAFALFDISIYHDFEGDVIKFYKDLANDILPLKVDEDTNFPNTFSHIFDGGYSAGYYGYMWADIYSIDAYLYVLENEVDNSKKFKEEFLSKGSSKDSKEIYENFRGQEVDENAFLKYYGLN